ncbi:ABC transporter substrate-binding protein [Syntrophotalea acetylenica]|jgi:spermidine/putrescine-binding protein|uniref:ABC transporter substrate-binding protein n=1 Tax=Syntrophotalea acetylenica TaxID=29542 RepID=A0A1L3GFI5_SYNAC|nr:ABC transporter substrate-binding protein [Syntrophotalea acetylenica]APG24448.1 ABC transporter substrate-binding protein [Syntrophotalea acetylenica]APG45033.1 ABC transporter substrate-binding protein [Syntrophotalea acetylenica]MDY0262371.1 ABC transporter substrate-binding protein [Syntrophotalea acetylenica]
MRKAFWSVPFVGILGLVAIGLALAPGCSKTKKETLRITCWAGYAKPYVAEFQKLVKEKHGIDVEVQISNPTDQDEFFQAVKDNTADLISPPIELPKTPRFYCYTAGSEYLQPVDVNNIPNLKNMMAVFRDDITPINAGNRYGVPYNCGPYGLAYNAGVIDTAPDTWNVLWEPRFAGKYTINNNFPKVNVWITALALGYGYADIFDIERLDREKIQQQLNILAQNAKSLWDGAANPDEFPELSLATTWGFAAQQANLKGGNWRIAAPKEGGTAWIDAWYLGAGAKGVTKTLAEEWINFMLDPARQADVVKSQGVSPVVADTGDLLNAEEKAMFHVGDENYFKTVALWRVMTEETEKAFNDMWEEAKKHRK